MMKLGTISKEKKKPIILVGMWKTLLRSKKHVT